jgi:AAA domain (dynein-related subfamily)
MLLGELKEHNFVYRLDYLARQQKLSYELEDLINFHTSLKTSRMTILGGMSGTGKTQLAYLYAQALGLKTSDNLLVIPVKPSYTEPSDILGFLNPQTGVYSESETGLVSFLKKAQNNKDKLYMVIFDEMNLGQVEHYFSDFISILELPGVDQTLQLFSPNSVCYQEDLRKGLKIGQNVLFVGTANFDETTKDFSNRLLDRSNVIRLEKPSFGSAKRREETVINTISDYEAEQGNELNDIEKEIDAEMFAEWIAASNSLQALEDDEISILDDIHDEISNFDSQTGVSFRIAKQIGHYIDNIPAHEDTSPMMPRQLAFDYQIKQRILSKIRGHRDQIEQLVGVFDEETEKVQPGRLGLILQTLRGEQDEKAVSEKFLEQKAKELMRNGYTL